MPNLARIFKKFPGKPLPEYPTIEIGDIPPASALLFYGGNWATELVGSRVYRHPYQLPAFHAALYLGGGDILNVGKFKTIERLKPEFHEPRRVDVVIYDITAELRAEIVRAAYRDIDRPRFGFMLPTYGFTDFLRFGIKWFKPSKRDICSENVAEIMGAHGVRVSDQETFNTAPWDIQEFAEANPSNCHLLTVWRGEDFKG